MWYMIYDILLLFENRSIKKLSQQLLIMIEYDELETFS